MRRCVLCLVLFAGCGRIGFGAAAGGDARISDTAGDGAPGDATPPGDAIDAASTGSAGPRWLATIDSTNSLAIGGANGQVVAEVEFQGSATAVLVQGSATTGSATVLGQSPYQSTFAQRFDATGALGASSVLDSAGFCNMRGLAMLADGSVLAVGLAKGGGSALGPCDVVTSREDPIAIDVAADGSASLVWHWAAGGQNAQAWAAAQAADGTIAISGIYGDTLSVGTTALPTALSDENAFYARMAAAAAAPAWTVTVPTASQSTPAPVDVDGSDTCIAGAWTGSATLFGSAMANAGGQDAFVARVDATGTPRFVRLVSSTATDQVVSLLATSDGGCIASVIAGDLDIDGTSLPASGGAGALLHFGPTGTLVAGARLPAETWVARAGSTLYGAFTASTAVTIGTTTYTPSGDDVVIVALADTGPTSLVGSIGGAGTQQVVQLIAVAADELALALTTSGALSFGSFSTNSTAAIAAVAALGL